MCGYHYRRWRINGTPGDDIKKATFTIEDRVARYIDTNGPVLLENLGACWNWTGGVFPNTGRPRVYVGGGKKASAHKVIYELRVGPVPAGLTLDHLCENISCVNPRHLEPVTAAENVRRWLQGGLQADAEKAQSRLNDRVGAAIALQRSKTHCPYGHAYTPETTIVNKKGQRSCRVCRQERSRSRAGQPPS